MERCKCKGEIAVARRKGNLFCRSCGGVAPSGTITAWGKSWADVKRIVVE
jgi:hypothetical protein